MSATAAVEEPPPAATGPQAKGGFPTSPRARKVARELGVDISQVTPCGASGRIIEEDVRRFAETKQPQVAKAVPADLRRRHLIAERLTKSIQTIPHFSVSVEVRADQLVALRESLKVPVEQQTGQKITVTDLLLKALGVALNETSGMRMVWGEGNCQAVQAIDLGLAIAAESGVVAPVIRKVEALDLAAIAQEDLPGRSGNVTGVGGDRFDIHQGIVGPFDGGVDRDGRTVDDELRRRRRRPRALDRGEDAVGEIFRRTQRFAERHGARRDVHDGHIGERPADVDRDAAACDHASVSAAVRSADAASRGPSGSRPKRVSISFKIDVVS